MTVDTRELLRQAARTRRRQRIRMVNQYGEELTSDSGEIWKVGSVDRTKHYHKERQMTESERRAALVRDNKQAGRGTFAAGGIPAHNPKNPDVISRLEAWADSFPTVNSPMLMREAAAEIRRLRDVNSQLRQDLTGWKEEGARLAEQLAELGRENERLRTDLAGYKAQVEYLEASRTGYHPDVDNRSGRERTGGR